MARNKRMDKTKAGLINTRAGSACSAMLVPTHFGVAARQHIGSFF
jgi:hypothetical protein